MKQQPAVCFLIILRHQFQILPLGLFQGSLPNINSPFRSPLTHLTLENLHTNFQWRKQHPSKRYRSWCKRWARVAIQTPQSQTFNRCSPKSFVFITPRFVLSGFVKTFVLKIGHIFDTTHTSGWKMCGDGAAQSA